GYPARPDPFHRRAEAVVQVLPQEALERVSAPQAPEQRAVAGEGDGVDAAEEAPALLQRALPRPRPELRPDVVQRRGRDPPVQEGGEPARLVGNLQVPWREEVRLPLVQEPGGLAGDVEPPRHPGVARALDDQGPPGPEADGSEAVAVLLVEPDLDDAGFLVQAR